MFNYFDVIAAAVILLGGYFGLQTGILASSFYVASGFVGMWAAGRFSAQLGVHFYVLFFLTAAAVILTGFLLGRIFKKLFLGTVDRLVGALLGLVLGLLIVGMALVPAFSHISGKAGERAAASFTCSRVLPYLYKAVPGVRRFSVKRVTGALPAVKRLSIAGRGASDAAKDVK